MKRFLAAVGILLIIIGISIYTLVDCSKASIGLRSTRRRYGSRWKKKAPPPPSANARS